MHLHEKFFSASCKNVIRTKVYFTQVHSKLKSIEFFLKTLLCLSAPLILEMFGVYSKKNLQSSINFDKIKFREYGVLYSNFLHVIFVRSYTQVESVINNSFSKVMKSRICFQTKLKILAKLINSHFPERLNYRRFSNNFH